MINEMEKEIINGTGPGPGLFEAVNARGERFITNVRRLAGQGRDPGSVLIAAAGFLLAALAGGLLYVTFKAQYQYIFAAKHQNAASIIQALMLDCGMIIFSLLALGLSRAGKSSRTERILIMVCAGASAGMSYAASDTASPRSVAAYVAAPVFLAIVVNRVIAVVRRHVLAGEETSAWTALGAVVLGLARLSALVLLYSLRTVLAPRETFTGIRRMVLAAAPVPGVIAVPAIQTRTDSGTSPPPETEPTRQDLDEHYLDQQEKDRYDFAEATATFLDKYRRNEEYGDRTAAARVAALIAPLAGLRPGTGRVLAFEEIDRREQAERDGNPVFPTKKAAFLSRYRAHPEYGVRAVAARVAAEIAPLAGLQPGTGRTYAGEELNRLEAAASRRELANGAAS